MRQPIFTKNHVGRIELALVVSLVSIMAATFGLIYSSNYSPLLVFGAVAAAIVFAMWVIRPYLAFYVAMLVVMLPVGMLPLEIHSQLNRALTVVAFGVWALAVLIKRQRVYWNATTIITLAFLLWSLVTLLWADSFDWAKTIIQVYLLRFVLFIFILPNCIRTKRALDGMFITLALIGWIVIAFSVYALMQEGYTPGSRFKLLGVNENDASTIIQITYLGVLWVTTQLSERKRIVKITLAFVYLLFTIFFVSASGSRGGAISLVVTLIAFLLWKETRPWSLLCIFLLVLAVIFFPSIFITTVDRFSLQASDSQSLLGGREVLWKAAWEMIRDNPLGGVGVGNAGLQIQPYLQVAFNIDGVSAHNPLLVVWSESGLVGLLLYIGILMSAVITFVKQFWRYKNLNKHHPYLPYFAIVSSIFLGYMISWVKGGGMESAHSYFFMLALLLVPSGLEPISKSNASDLILKS